MADKTKVDPDREAEGAARGTNPNAAPAQKETAKQAASRRVAGARFYAGAWVAEDGTPLTDAEAQQAHRAADAANAKARAKALLGGE